MKLPNHPIIRLAGFVISFVCIVLVLFVLTIGSLNIRNFPYKPLTVVHDSIMTDEWSPPDIKSIPANDTGKLIKYGRELVLYTGKYLGPNGKVKSASNGMDCDNCHLNGGTKHFGNNFSAVFSTYPKFRPRFGAITSIERRINDCFERSLNGQPLDSGSRELQAIVAYMRWLGKNVKKGTAPNGSGLIELPYLNRAASVEKGELVYKQNCQVCHGKSGEGMWNKTNSEWLNPPLWGNQSYNNGAGMYRIGRLAAFVKANMPWGATASSTELSDEEAWDVAAYINSQPRPQKDMTNDWPDSSLKAIDFPYGPFDDGLSEEQHKYGPYQPILDFRENPISKKISAIIK